MVRVVSDFGECGSFSAALGGAGWGLSAPAAVLALEHVALFHSLVGSMPCRKGDCGAHGAHGEWALPATHLGREIVDAGRGFKLRSPFADDIIWGCYMAALGVPAVQPREPCALLL